MRQQLKDLNQKVWFIWLMAAYAILFLYNYNKAFVFVEEFLVALVATLLAVGLLVGLFWLLSRDIYRASVLTAVVIVMFFSYGHIRSLFSGIEKTTTLALLFRNQRIIWLIVTAIGIGTVLRWVTPALARQAAPALNIVSLALVLFSGLPIVAFWLAKWSEASPTAPTESDPKVMNDAAHPDIYYVILDAYSSNKHLMRDWGFDNSDFTDSLEERGFVIAYDSLSNYPATLPSLASSLNMRFLAEDENPPTDPSGVNYARQLIADNEVARQLMSRGYTYIFILSGFDRPSTIADLNVDMFRDGPHRFARGELEPDPHAGQGSFFPVLFDSTLLKGLGLDENASKLTAPLIVNNGDKPRNFMNSSRARWTWQEAERVAEMPEATFTIVHLILPHSPIRFDRNGNDIPKPDKEDLQYSYYYFEQLFFINNRTLQMIDVIREKSSTSPIIIIQGDHGSNLGFMRNFEHPELEVPYYEILNAYYFPNGGNASIYQTISPANSFRVLFNTYFDGDFDLLPDNYQRRSRSTNPFQFIEP